MQTETFCRACESFGSSAGHDYSGGPGVTKCSCGKKNTIFEVPKGEHDLIKQLNQIFERGFPRVIAELEEDRLTVRQAKTLAEEADPNNFSTNVTPKHAEEALFELLDEVR